jgi:hypothetical protein
MAYAFLATRNRNGWHPGLGMLGQSNPTLTAAAALQQAIQMYAGQNLNPAETQNSGWLDAAESAITSGSIDVTGGLGPNCSGQTAQPLNLLKTAQGLVLSTAGAATAIGTATGVISAATGTILGAATMGVGLIISVIAMIFQHHAAAVSRDLAFGCSAIPAVNNALAVVQQAVATGAATPADAANSLAEVYSQYMSAGGASGSISGPGSIPGSGAAINKDPYCNSNCELSIIVLAMVLYWSAQFEAQASQQATQAAEVSGSSALPASVAPSAPVSQGGSTVPQILASPAAAISSIPAWGWVLGGLAALWALGAF